MITAAPQIRLARIGCAVTWDDIIPGGYESELVGNSDSAPPHRTPFEIEHDFIPAMSFDAIAAQMNCSRQLVCRFYARAIIKLMKQGG